MFIISVSSLIDSLNLKKKRSKIRNAIRFNVKIFELSVIDSFVKFENFK